MIRKLTVLLLLLTVSGFSQLKTTNANKEIPSPALMQKILDAWTSGDFANAAPFYDKDPNDTFFDLAPLEYHGFDEYLEGVPTALAGVESIKFTVHQNATIHREGAWAWGTATWDANGKFKNGNRLGLVGRWTCVWQERDGKWLIVHEHFSVPWNPEPEERQK